MAGVSWYSPKSTKTSKKHRKVNLFVISPFGEVINPNETYVIVLDKRDSLGTGLETPIWNGYQLWDVCVINGDTLLTPQGDTVYCVQYDPNNNIPFYGTEYNDFLDLEGKADIFLSPQFSVNSAMYFNGDDAVVLFKGTTINSTGSNIIDVVGVIGEDPGDSWLDNNGTRLTQNKTLIRNPDVQKGTGAVFFTAQDSFDYAQYTVFPNNYFDGLGFHVSSCNITNCPADLTLTSQEEIDDFTSAYPNCTEIDGFLFIEDNGSGTPITNLNGLSQITSVEGTLRVANNNSLTDLSGLNNLTMIGGDFYIDSCFSLISISGFENLLSIGNGGLSITGNDQLINFSGFENLVSINGLIFILNNFELENLEGLENLNSFTGGLFISGNQALSVCNYQSICNYISNGGSTSIGSNASGCNSLQEVETACGINPPCIGDITLTTQAEVDAFDTSCQIIDGNLTISGADITDLSNLAGITQVTGDIFIKNNPLLIDLGGLDGLTNVGGCLHVLNNDALQNINALINITSIETDIFIENNPFLININGLGGLTIINGGFRLVNLPALENIDGISGVLEITMQVFIDNCPSLLNILGFQQVIFIGGDIQISNCILITDLSGFSSLTIIGGTIRIQGNGGILNLQGLNGVISIGGDFFITDVSDLNSLQVLINLEFIGGCFHLQNLDNLVSLAGLENLGTVGTELVITDNPNLTDFCAILNLLQNNGVGGTITLSGNPAGYNTVADVIDSCTNQTCSAPLCITCPSDITVHIPVNELETPVSWTPPTITSTCPDGFISGTNNQGNGGIFNVGTTEIHEWVIDACGNDVNCSFTVTVINDVFPTPVLTIDCPQDMTIEIPVSETQTSVSWTPPTIVSSCPWGFTAGTNGTENGGNYGIGTTPVSEYVVDGCGNIVNCTFNITVVNSIATTGDLTLDCPPNFTVEAAFGANNAAVTWDDPIANSSCGGATVIQKGGMPKGSMFPLGWTCIPYRAFDDCNDVQECFVCFEVVENGSTLTNTVPNTLLALPQIFELETQLQNGNQVKIDWYTNGDFSNAPFLVERSSNGAPFKVIETVENLNSNTPLIHQELMDFNPAKGENYYRIRVPSSSGVDYFSNVEMENILKVDRLLVYPNPAQEKVFVKLSDFDGKKCNLQITNQYGQTIFQAETIGNEDHPFEIDLRDWKNGIYYLSMKPENGRMISRKLVVARLY